eukprot:TRINITY_DN1051_c0_g1_i2.p1 TRINITY_DN1051_c0_g1~~TRINITY_DN1051_c0_g1_i2.p1  ORF type:complete len:277 (-),score=88.00 TRINITY_DN1051_c0_g1_i2:1083-1868(-)
MSGIVGGAMDFIFASSKNTAEVVSRTAAFLTSGGASNLNITAISKLMIGILPKLMELARTPQFEKTIIAGLRVFAKFLDLVKGEETQQIILKSLELVRKEEMHAIVLNSLLLMRSQEAEELFVVFSKSVLEGLTLIKSPEFSDARSQIESLTTEVVEQVGAIAQEISNQVTMYITTPVNPEDRMSEDEVVFWATTMTDIDFLHKAKFISESESVFLRRLARKRNAEVRIIFSAYPRATNIEELVRELKEMTSEYLAEVKQD